MVGKLFVLGVASLAAYLGARRLIDDPALINQLPDAARDPARKLRAQLIEVESLLNEVIADMAEERATVEEDLRADFASRARRATDPTPDWRPATD
ncbi:MAG: hypothetical protein U0360_08935 [Dehalococcoidia bacterium]